MTELTVGRIRIPTIALILAAFVLLATTYSQVTPLGEAPDEAPHFTVIRYIVQNGHLPSTEEEHEAFQPPLYYLIGAGLTFWADYDGYVIKANADYSLDEGQPKNLLLHASDEAFPYRGWALTWRLLRLVSVLYGAVTVWATYWIGRTLFRDRPAIGLLMAILNAFIPEFLFMSGLINNDNLAAMFAALLLLQISRLVTGQDDWITVGSLGVLLGLGVLSKVSVAITALPAGLALLYAAWKRDGSTGKVIRRTLGWGAIVSLLTLLIAGWWFARNLILHDDLTGWAFILETNALREGPLTPDILWWLARGLFKSFWLAWIGIELHTELYLGLLGMCLMATAGLARLLLPDRRHDLPRDTRVGMGLLALQVVLVVASLLQWTATVLGTDQARLLYPALPALLMFLALGLAQWVPPRRDGWLIRGMAIVFFLLAAAAPWVYIAPVHAGPTPISAEDLRERAQPSAIVFGESIQLAGYRVDPTAQAGGWLTIDLYWKALRPIEKDLWLTISLAGDDPMQPLVVKDGSPSAGRDTTDRWKAGQILPSRHRLLVPAHAEEGLYGVWIGLHPFGEWAWLPTETDPGIPLRLADVQIVQ
jgi:4-amino-4-deoxy-L-arabinose transferase-like glycosyltransferase